MRIRARSRRRNASDSNCIAVFLDTKGRTQFVTNCMITCHLQIVACRVLKITKKTCIVISTFDSNRRLRHPQHRWKRCFLHPNTFEMALTCLPGSSAQHNSLALRHNRAIHLRHQKTRMRVNFISCFTPMELRIRWTVLCDHHRTVPRAWEG